MTDWDKDYLELCKTIINEGVEVENRTGINTIKLPSYNLKFDLEKEFPILTTKQLLSRACILEMLWIWQAQSNDVRWLQERNVKIWNEWMVDPDGIYRIYEPYGEYDPDKEVVVLDPLSVPVDDYEGLFHDFQLKKTRSGKTMTAKSLIPGKTIKAAKWYGKKYANTIGTAYGFITNRYKFARNLIETIKTDPTNRRMLTSLWQNEFLRTAVLPSCVWSSEWDVTNGKLNINVHQRSCDVPLGLPFNITQYATLLSMIAKVTGLQPGTIDYSIKDAHIYVNQLDGIKKQLDHAKTYERFSNLSKEELQELKTILKSKMKEIEAINPDNYKELKDYKLISSEYNTVDMILEPTKPELWLNPEIDNFFEFDNSKELKDIKVLNYKHMGKIEIPIAQ